ncbi:hypothetical protein QQS21_011095 [Conoideocrella luteorostrata]|uniref:Uncharacterized protein n=1 Tax=Conoideocrella luteorostrata TaxID=1105319 RepID=A0AAJ0FW74_9HYPO|nr:hypothetical protein QQS21_011095 [Conoideocrella luteorostrata]
MFDSMYAAQNALDVSASSSKFFATTAVNTGLCVFKDGYSAKLACKLPVPSMTYAMFLARDAVAVFAYCNLPTLIAPKLADLPLPSLIPSFGQSTSSLQAAQLLSPAAAQVVSTPIHILGLDLHKRQNRVPIGNRIRTVCKHIGFATPFRMLWVVSPSDSEMLLTRPAETGCFRRVSGGNSRAACDRVFVRS